VTVKPLNMDHPRDVVDRWSLFRGKFIKKVKSGLENGNRVVAQPVAIQERSLVQVVETYFVYL
jgi:hypothetical protein